MRRKSEERADPLVRPGKILYPWAFLHVNLHLHLDIRSLYVSFLLGFLGVESPTQIKTIFLEQHKDAVLAIFKGIADDHYSLARKILEVSWVGIWEDNKIKRTLKVGLFNEITVGHVNIRSPKCSRIELTSTSAHQTLRPHGKRRR